jgi:hypothetical protein
MNKSPLEVLEMAKAASIAKSLEIWNRDEQRDCGSCGGAVMFLDKRSKLAKVAVAEGFAWGDDVAVKRFIADGVRSQNADIFQDSARAFKRVLEENGYANAIKKFWTYID